MGIASSAASVCAALAAFAAGPALALDLIGQERAELAWAPASGEVSAYVIFVSRNGGPYRSEQYTSAPSAVVAGRSGDTLLVRVRAYGVEGGLTLSSAASEPSDPIRFLPADPGGPAAVGSAPPALSTPLGENVRRIPGAQFVPEIGVQTHGDFDGDGNLDLLATLGSWQHPIALFLKGGSLQHAACLAPLDSESGALAADFDGDGRDELALRAAGQLTVLRLERGGALTALAREPVSATARVVAADLDGDKAASLVVYEPATGRLSERLAKRKAIDFGSISPLHALFAGDFNGDGRDDLWIQPTAGADPELWLMEAGGGFKVAALRLGRSVSPAIIADVNGDGRADLAGYDAARGELRAFLLDGGRVIGERPIAKGPLETLRSGDVDGDGDDDLLTRAPSGEESALLLAR